MRSPRRPLGRGTVTGLALIGVFVVGAVLAPWIAPNDPEAQHLTRRFEGPSGDFWLGTDDLGRDTLSRLIFGARVSLQAVVQALVVASVIGIPLGLLTGYRGGWWDRIVMCLVDVVFSVPGIVVAFTAIALLGPGLTPAMLGVGIVFATRYARLVRGLVISAREQLYVDAARVGGASSPRIVAREILPNVAGPVIVQTAVFAGGVILIEATLSFFGLGAPVNEASWGSMLNRARTLQFESAWLPFPPGIAITLAVLAFNLVSDGFRDRASGRGDRHQLTARRPDAEPGDRAPTTAALAVEDLGIEIAGTRGAAQVVHRVSLTVDEGETVALVGESGSGKTMTALAVMGLLPASARVTAGSIRLHGEELVGASEAELRRHRAHAMSMIFQEPVASLNPALTVGRQLAEPLRVHAGLSRRQARARAVELLAQVGVPDPARRVDDHPHQFSGGLAQRVMIAMALATEPGVLIADEPTTALDVTVQSQIVDLLLGIQAERGLGILFITHDLALVADVADRAVVLRDGRVVESAPVGALFSSPAEPYTAELITAADPAAAVSERPVEEACT